MTDIHIDKMKSTDWHYDKLSGDLRQYLKAARSYHTTIEMLTYLQPDDIRDLISKYVPADMQNEVYSELMRKVSRKPAQYV